MIGHTEGAAGLAGVLKVMLAMRHSTVPPNLHLETLNPSVEPFYTNLRIPTTPQSWPQVPTGQPKRASVNSFGFGGTNSHAIIEEYKPAIHDAVASTFSSRRLSLPRSISKSADVDAPAVVLPLLLSGNSQKALMSVAEKYLDYLTAHPSVQPEQLAWHTFARRTALPFKVAVSAATQADLQSSLKGLVEKAKLAPAVGTRSRAAADGGPKILGVFTGQGAQWATMSSGLLLTSKVYRDTIRELDDVLRQCPSPPPWTLEQEINAEESLSRVAVAAISQPLCTAIQIGLVNVLRSLGIRFHTVVGHSSGEMAAAYAAGRLSARDAMLISYYRGKFAHMAGGASGEKGAMMAVGLSKQDATELCSRAEYRGGICVAASNAPTSVTLSGDMDIVQKARDDLAEQKVFARMLQVDTAYHSPHMTKPAINYLEALAKVKVSPPKVGNGTNWVSSVHGTREPSQGALEAEYWKDNMVQTVLFHEALSSALKEHGPFSFTIEVGPHPALKGPTTQTIKAVNGSAIPYTGVLDRKKDDRVAFAEFIGSLWTEFGPSALQLRPYVESSTRPDLVHRHLEEPPTYPWDHSQTYYRESRIAKQYHFRAEAPHELLGVRTRDDTEYEMRWRNILKLDKLPWIAGHDFQGQALLPASGYCVMARDAAMVALAGRAASVIELEDLEFPSGITVEADSQGVETLFSLNILPGTRDNRLNSTIDATFVLASAPADGSATMKKNFSGRVRILLAEPSAHALPPRAKWHAEALEVSSDGFYKMMADTGLRYNGAFKGLQTMERRLDFASTTLRKRHPDDTTTLSLSPATLDTCLQTCFATYSSPGDK